MTLELDIQNPLGSTHLPSDEEFQCWADMAFQKTVSEVDIEQETEERNQSYSVVIRVTDEAESQELNSAYREKNAPTNVLSFPFEMPDLPELEISGHSSPEQVDKESIIHVGDLVFCEPVIEKEALEQNKALFQHWAHLVIHGMLHLQGFDHIDDKDAERMESLEINMMQQLKLPNPYE